MSSRIGVIGGLGPSAGIRMAQQLVELAQDRGAILDADFPDFMLLNVPAKGMNELGFTDPEAIRHALVQAIKLLAKADCRYIVIACNTAHLFYEDLDELTHAEVLNMIEIACDEVRGCKSVGVLSSESTKEYRLYAGALEERKIHPVLTNFHEQTSLNKIVANVMAGTHDQHDEFRLIGIIDAMVSRGAEKVILGCTELPLVLSRKIPASIVDAGRVTIAKALSRL